MWSKLKSPDDGWIDMSGFLDQKFGFVPLVVPITEPAVGFGAAGGLTFVQAPKAGAVQDAFARPNMTAVGGLGTENGTWGAFGADVRHWGNNRWQTIVGAVDASVNLDFHGTGEVPPPLQEIGYNLHPVAGFGQVKYRVGNSRMWLGVSYIFANAKVTFEAPDTTPGLPDVERETNIAGATPSFSYDSRDSLFTPNKGSYIEVRAGLFAPELGGDDEFQRYSLLGMQYVPFHPRFILGARVDAGWTFGDAPFYVRPFVTLRGVPVMAYQRDNLAQLELEVRYQFWKRLSAVIFGGYGSVWNDEVQFERKLGVGAGGLGFRYELARKYQMHMGVDVGYGPDGPALYIVFGNAWIRP